MRMEYENHMAVAAGGDAILLEDPGVFFFYAILQGGPGSYTHHKLPTKLEV
jgi:hypothetical protein